MEGQKKEPSILRMAFPICLPVMIGYIFVGFAMGLLSQQAGYPWWIVLIMDLFLYAGAMQFLAVELLTNGTSLLNIAFITLFVQSRHAFYGLSLLQRYRSSWRLKPYMIFSLTDEAYTLLTAYPPPPSVSVASYDLAIVSLCHASWTVGTLLGAVSGSLIKIPLQGLDFALTALFVSTCVEQWKQAKSHIPAIGTAVVSVLMLLLFGADRFMLPALFAIVLMLFVFRKPIEKKMPQSDSPSSTVVVPPEDIGGPLQ